MPRLLRSAEIALWSLGLACSVVLGADKLEVVRAQRSAAAIGSTDPTHSSASAAPQPSNAPLANPEAHAVLGRLEIPALRLSTPIVDDDDTASLLRGAGHIRGTALPGGLGNFVVAAHRDTYFRPLSGIRPGMKIRVVTAEATYTYIVDSTKIVLPDQVDVLDMGDVPQMTLITCYPFHYIGAAPKRFTVQAHLESF